MKKRGVQGRASKNDIELGEGEGNIKKRKTKTDLGQAVAIQTRFVPWGGEIDWADPHGAKHSGRLGGGKGD